MSHYIKTTQPCRDWITAPHLLWQHTWWHPLSCHSYSQFPLPAASWWAGLARPHFSARLLQRLLNNLQWHCCQMDSPSCYWATRQTGTLKGTTLLCYTLMPRTIQTASSALTCPSTIISTHTTCSCGCTVMVLYPCSPGSHNGCTAISHPTSVIIFPAHQWCHCLGSGWHYPPHHSGHRTMDSEAFQIYI